MGICNSCTSNVPPSTFNNKNVCKATKDIIFFEEDGPAVVKGEFVVVENYHSYGLGSNDSITVKILSFDNNEWTESKHFVVIPRNILKEI